MAPVRLGNGAGLTPNGFAEWRKGDGTVVWTSGDPSGDLPASVTDHWRIDEGSGTVLANEIGSVDFGLSGATWVSDSDGVGGQATDYDGTNDYALTQSAFSVNQAQMTVFVWFTPSNLPSNMVITSTDPNGPTNNSSGWRIDIAASANGGVRFGHRNSGGNFTEVATLYDGGSDINNDKRYLAVQSMDGDSAECYLFDNDGLVGSGSGTGSRWTGGDTPIHLATRRERDGWYEGLIDAAGLSRGTQMSQSEIEDYHAATSP